MSLATPPGNLKGDLAKGLLKKRLTYRQCLFLFHPNLQRTLAIALCAFSVELDPSSFLPQAVAPTFHVAPQLQGHFSAMSRGN